MHVSPGRLPSVLFYALTSVLVTPALLLAQTATLSIDGAEAVPGRPVSVFLRASLDSPIRGFQVGFEIPQALTLDRITLEGTDLVDLNPETFEVDIEDRFATVRLIKGTSPPFENPIPALPNVKLARLDFRMDQNLEPGAKYSVTPKSGLGYPPLPALIYAGATSFGPTRLDAGVIGVFEEDVLIVSDVPDARPEGVVAVDVLGFNVEAIQGFQICIKYDSTKLRFQTLDMEDTLPGSLGAESINPQIDDANGSIVLGVLMELQPPIDKLIPVTGSSQLFARLKFQVTGAAPGTTIAVDLTDGLGIPPHLNVFVIDNHSFPPRKMSGVVTVVPEAQSGPFIRGDANDDGKLDISDPIATAFWIFINEYHVVCEKAADSNDDGVVDLLDIVHSLHYLFTDRTVIIPPPFPQKGPDPTPDDLACPQ